MCMFIGGIRLLVADLLFPEGHADKSKAFLARVDGEAGLCAVEVGVGIQELSSQYRWIYESPGMFLPFHGVVLSNPHASLPTRRNSKTGSRTGHWARSSSGHFIPFRFIRIF